MPDPVSGGTHLIIDQFEQASAIAIVDKIAQVVADKYVAEHYQEIVALIDQNAIATLVVAESGRKIAEEIRSQPRIVETVKREIYQRGILGGVRRVL